MTEVLNEDGHIWVIFYAFPKTDCPQECINGSLKEDEDEADQNTHCGGSMIGTSKGQKISLTPHWEDINAAAQLRDEWRDFVDALCTTDGSGGSKV